MVIFRSSAGKACERIVVCKGCVRSYPSPAASSRSNHGWDILAKQRVRIIEVQTRSSYKPKSRVVLRSHVYGLEGRCVRNFLVDITGSGDERQIDSLSDGLFRNQVGIRSGTSEGRNNRHTTLVAQTQHGGYFRNRQCSGSGGPTRVVSKERIIRNRFQCLNCGGTGIGRFQIGYACIKTLKNGHLCAIHQTARNRSRGGNLIGAGDVLTCVRGEAAGNSHRLPKRRIRRFDSQTSQNRHVHPTAARNKISTGVSDRSVPSIRGRSQGYSREGPPLPAPRSNASRPLNQTFVELPTSAVEVVNNIALIIRRVGVPITLKIRRVRHSLTFSVFIF